MNRSSFSPAQSLLIRASKNGRSMLQSMKKAVLSWRMLISAACILLLVLIFCIAITPVRYNISVGMVPTHTITANRDVVDEVTTEALRKQAESSVQYVYVTDDRVADEVLQNLNEIYEQMDLALQYSSTLPDAGSTRSYTSDELAYARKIITGIDLLDYQLTTLLNTSREALADLYEFLFDAIANAMSSYIIEGSESITINNILQVIGYNTPASLVKNVAQPLLNAVIKPNILIDREASQAAKEEARNAVEPVVYKQGQNIIVKGEGRVERYQYEMLSILGLLNNTSISITIYIGGAALVILVMCVALTALRILNKEIIFDIKRLTLLFIILILSFALCVVAVQFNIYLAPVTLAALLLAAMLGLRAACLFNAAVSILISALAAGGNTAYTSEMVNLLACGLCSGAIAAMLVYKHSSRVRIVLAGITVGICNFTIMLSLGMMTSTSMETALTNALWGLASGVISGALSIAIQPLLEVIFNLPTSSKLMELSNPNHPLLRRLLLEAPGTYHHSTVVANLAEAAAEAVGANPLLARVGGYYHDIGKLRRPLYFKENQLGGENKLAENDPYTAAQIVISHTRDGATLGRQYHLPREIIRIILEHHGNTPVMYFYTQALKEANGKNVDVANFRYDADPPNTKEGAIVLLCDTIEAAVRSMQNPTPEAIETFIVKLVRGKLQDGQLSSSPLTLKDIDDICQACTTVLNGVFHERIEYPDPPAPVPSKENADEPVPPDPEINSQLTQPWDGISKDETEEEIRTAPRQIEQIMPKVNEPPRQIPIDFDEFTMDEPLPLVDLPKAEELPTVEEIMQRMENPPRANPSSPEDGGDES